jgi:integrase
LANKFLTAKKHALDIGELNPRTFREYYKACEYILRVLGRKRAVADLRPVDFEKFARSMPATWGPVARGKMVQATRTVFGYAFNHDLIERPLKFGDFKRPSKKTLRLHRAKQGKRMFERDELARMLVYANPALEAMILLAVNCGLGNSDAASLPVCALDLDRGWLNFPRVKTGIPRRAKLWPETVEAIRQVIAVRPKPKDGADADLVFLTQRGARWVTVTMQKEEEGSIKVVTDDSVSKETRKLMKRLGISGRRSFYALRHTFETIGGESRDQVAVDAVMGHTDDSMGGVYRERISDERLAAVAEYVRQWLFEKAVGQ